MVGGKWVGWRVMHPHYCNAPCSNETLKHLWYSVAIFVVHQAVTPASHWQLVVNFLQHWCYTKEHWRLITLWYIDGTLRCIGGTPWPSCAALCHSFGTHRLPAGAGGPLVASGFDGTFFSPMSTPRGKQGGKDALHTVDNI